MNRWMHPGLDPWTMVEAEITTHGVMQQITEQQLIRQIHIRNRI